MTYVTQLMDDQGLWTQAVEEWSPADLDPEVDEEIGPDYGLLTEAEAAHAGMLMLGLFEGEREANPFHTVEVDGRKVRDLMEMAIERPPLLSEIQQAADWVDLIFWSTHNRRRREVFLLLERKG